MLVDFGSFHSRVDNVINDSFNYTVTRHRWNCQELLKRYIIFRSALIHIHLFVILTAIGWFILNIQSDLFWHRCLERQTFGTPRMYTLSLSQSIKRSNYGEFLKVKNVLFMYTMYYRQQRTSTLRIWKVCLHSNTQLIWSSGTIVWHHNNMYNILQNNTDIIIKM